MPVARMYAVTDHLLAVEVVFRDSRWDELSSVRVRTLSSPIRHLSSRPTGFEEQLVLQSRVRINAGLTLLALGVYTQLALVLKKKQFERLRL